MLTRATVSSQVSDVRGFVGAKLHLVPNQNFIVELRFPLPAQAHFALTQQNIFPRFGIYVGHRCEEFEALADGLAIGSGSGTLVVGVEQEPWEDTDGENALWGS